MEKKPVKQKTKVDVCIAAFNGEKFIFKTIQSVLGQTYSNFTLYVIDDNSSDKTLEIVRKIKDKRIIIRKNRRNLGMYQNINRCLSYAKSPYIKILCCDDVLDKRCLERQVRILEENPSVTLVYNSSKIIDFKDKPLFTRKFYSSDTLVKGEELIKKILKSGRNPIGEPSCIMLKKKIVKINHLLFDESLSYVADLDMWINILRHGDGYYISQPLSFYRIHSSSGTSKLLGKIVKEHLVLMKKYGREFEMSLFDCLTFYGRLLFFFFVKLLVYKLFVK